MSVTGGLLAASAWCAAEGWLRRRNPYRLARFTFDEGQPLVPHPMRGWTHKCEFEFDYHHRYLDAPNRVRLDAHGLHSHRSLDATPGVPRILYMGGSAACGWEHSAEATIAAALESRVSNSLSREVAVVNASMWGYCTRQLFWLFEEECAVASPDLVIYHFSEDHLRQNVTIHERGRPLRMSQPVDWRDPEGAWDQHHKRPRHANDWVFLDGSGRIVFRPGRARRSAGGWLRNHLHTYCALEEAVRGEPAPSIPSLPSHALSVFELLLGRLAGCVRDAGARLLVVSHGAINERFDLGEICRRQQVPHCDSEVTEESGAYIHPRYPAFSRSGVESHARCVAQAIADGELLAFCTSGARA